MKKMMCFILLGIYGLIASAQSPIFSLLQDPDDGTYYGELVWGTSEAPVTADHLIHDVVLPDGFRFESCQADISASWLATAVSTFCDDDRHMSIELTNNNGETTGYGEVARIPFVILADIDIYKMPMQGTVKVYGYVTGIPVPSGRSIDCFDLNGRLVFSAPANDQEFHYRLPAGMYVLVSTASGEVSKVIVSESR